MTDQLRRIVIAGAGLAGLRAGEALRTGGFDGQLSIVGDEHHPPYNRPPLSKQVLTGATEADRCLFPTDRLAATWHLGTPAAALDTTRRVVRLTDDRQLPYDGLILATGCRATTWPRALPPAGVHTLRTLDDCLALRHATGPGTRVAIVGAGFLGCEVAAALRTRGVGDVTLIDTAPHPMRALGATLGARIARLHAAHGARLKLGTSVSHVAGHHRVQALHLTDGTTIPADVVLFALGATPNTEWLAGSGLTLQHRRVLCDASCAAVGTERVVAAGDVAAWPQPGLGEPGGLEHWSNAIEMGQAAAATLLAEPGRGRPYIPVPTFWTDQYHLKIKSAGWLAQATHHSVLEDDPDTGRLVIETHRNSTLVGALTVNKPRSHIDYQRTLAPAQAPVS